MANPWLALDDGADPAERMGQVGRAHEDFLTDGRLDQRVRTVVADSWRRSAGSRCDPDGPAPIELCDDELESYRAAHPLARVLPVIRELLGDLAGDDDQLMAVCDAHGRLLWVEGHRVTRRRAERMNFVPGARWDEANAGTNAPGTALAVDHGVQIFATEHFNHRVQPWTCAAAPVHDPLTGRLLGAVDLTGGDRLANPYSLALVQATARAAEAYLAGGTYLTGGLYLAGPGRAAPPTTVGMVHVLGRDEALVRVGGRRPVRLGLRLSELLVLLLAHPEGRSGEQLALDLYGERSRAPVTVRAELSRLRRLLGAELVDSRPYRLHPGVDADLLTVTRLVERGELAAALRAYPGPLLPASDAPGVVRLRRLLDGQVRAAVLASGDAELLSAWARTPAGAEDLQVWERLAVVLPAGSSRQALALERVRQLTADYAPPAAQPLPATRPLPATSRQRSGN